MDKPRLPHVTRTWVSPRTRRAVPIYPAPHAENPRRNFPRATQPAAKPPRKEEHKEPEP